MAISEGTLAIGSRVMLPNGSTNNSLSELNDVNISNASDGQILVYDETTNKWKNQNESIPNAYYALQSSEITVPANTNTILVTLPEIKKGTYMLCGSSKINTMPQSAVQRYIQFTMSNGDKICEMTVYQSAYATIRIPISGVVTFSSDLTNVTLIVYLREELKIAETEIGLIKIL